jgi:glycosyltransferase involved in cell wall biosynthesis
VRLLSVVIPALNEYGNLRRVIASIPVAELRSQGWATEVVVVDNGSTDGTGDLARELGATVIEQPVRGYGNAYAAGFAAARGEVIATADADLTYPLDHLLALLSILEESTAEFMTTDRLRWADRRTMKPSHALGNHVLSFTARALFGHSFKDSQSGMWIFRRTAWAQLEVHSRGMAFSQEIKNEAFAKGLRCIEVPIEYRPRGGQVKLNVARDGVGNLCQLFHHRRRLGRSFSAASRRVALSTVALVPSQGGRVDLEIIERELLTSGRAVEVLAD